MVNKQILQHQHQKDKGATKFFITLTLLLSSTVFILAMNSSESNFEKHTSVASSESNFEKHTSVASSESNFEKHTSVASFDNQLIEALPDIMGPPPAMGGGLSDIVDPPMGEKLGLLEPQGEEIEALSDNQNSHTIEQAADAQDLALAQPASSEAFTESKADVVFSHTIKTGETFSHILEEYGYYGIIRKLMENNVKLGPFNFLVAGRKIIFTKRNEVLVDINYQLSSTRNYKLSRQADGSYEISEEILKIEKMETQATVEITDSLYLSAKRIGLSDKLIISIANIMEWDIDFAYDVRKGDHFSVIYYENYIGNKKIDDGAILALSFTNNDRDYNIVRYTDSKNYTDYYFLDGRKVRKAFLRNPLEFSYISSRFNPKRTHPILHRVRAHKGVDYAARRGTPVRASGDGRISRRQFYNGYGNTVVLQHGGGYSTLYAHLSKFADRQRIGSWVKQGQVVGYVGSTGLSTGPHLHYEFRVNGVHKNPLTVKLPDALPLEKSELPRFNEHIKPIKEKLHLLDDAYIAGKSY